MHVVIFVGKRENPQVELGVDPRAEEFSTYENDAYKMKNIGK